jgi:hypothetical protein
MLFVMAFANAVYAFSSGTPFSYSGKIVSIDNSHKILTVQAASGDQKIFRLSDNATLMQCDKSVAWNDVKVGDEITVAYFQDGNNNFIASDLSLSLPMSEHCS